MNSLVDTLRIIFYSVSGGVALTVLSVLALWKYDPMYHSQAEVHMHQSDLAMYGLLWNISFPCHGCGGGSVDQPLTLLIDTTMTGYLNYDVWYWVVGYLVDDLRIYREFPQFPDDRGKISSLHTEFNEVDPADVRGRYGHRIYGYLIPPKTGGYQFKVELTEMTAAATVEVWLSPNSSPFNSSRVITLTYQDLNRKTATTRSQESGEVKLEGSQRYYFEFLEKAADGKVVADVKWKLPSSTDYVSIPSQSFSMALKLSKDDGFVSHATEQLLTSSLPSNQLQDHHRVRTPTDDLYPVTNLNVLPGCEFHPQYAMKRVVKTYEGYKQVHQSLVYPKDDTWFKKESKPDRGNPPITKSTADSLVSMYSKALNASKEVKGRVVGLHYLEETTNKADGSRFLLELDVQLSQPREELVHTSEYVYLKKGSTQLCHTSNFQWTRGVDVHFVVSVKNLGFWIKHLIYNVEWIYEKTKDEHFSLIIVDYQSEDMNIEEEAKKSSFKRITVLHLNGGFSRSGGLQAGVEHVKDEKSIVMTIDMHLTLPVGTVEYVRKHTVEHKMAYTPMFFRLNLGYTEVNYNGFWETLTYGLFAMYKTDWIASRGFNTKKYQTKWGGEDWDVLDKVLAIGLEAFRIRPPGLVHYHHTKKGMWGNTEIKFTKKWTLH